MARYVVRRSVFLVTSLVVSMLVIFLLLHVLPGDPANALLPIDATPEQVAAARHKVGSDRSVLVQLWNWAAGMARGDFGQSIASGESVFGEVTRRLAITAPLTLIAFVVATILSAVLGFVAAYKANRWYGLTISGLSQAGVAIPIFWTGIILVWVFALWLRVLPSAGFPRNDWADPGVALTSLVLPIVSVVLGMTAVLTRYVRAATLDVLGSDYMRTARSLGASVPGAFLRHGLRNACVPVISMLGIELGGTFVGAVVVEGVFALPGLGSMLVKAIAQHDYPAIQGVLVTATLVVLLAGFLADIVQRLVDPRLRTRTVRRVG